MRVKDPMAWIEDLTVHIADEDMPGTVEQVESTVRFGGSKLGVGAGIAVAGVLGGGFGSVMLSPDLRGSVVAFAAYLVAAFVLLRFARPVVHRLLAPGVSFYVLSSIFWTFLLGLLAAVAGRVGSGLLAWGLSVGIGFFDGADGRAHNAAVG